MSAMSNDKRLQALFRVLDGNGTPHEIAAAVAAINRHLASSGKRLKDLTLSEAAAPTNPVDDLLKQADEHKARMERDKRTRAFADSQIKRADQKRREAEIQRDVLATFVSARVLDVARTQALNIVQRIKDGETYEDVAKSFGRPGWANKTGDRPDRHWGW